MLFVINYASVIEYLVDLSLFVCTVIDQSKFGAQSVKTTQKSFTRWFRDKQKLGRKRDVFHPHHL